jgi:2'-5' RNA ligase
MARDRASRPEAKPQRLFVAADIPDAVRDALAGAIQPLRERLRGRWVPPANWHVTLKFLGSTWPRLLDWVHEEVEAVASRHDGFESSLEGVGAFPNARRARVLWAGLEDPGGRLAAIATDLDEAMSQEFKVEKRAFTAHLTVARFDPPAAVGEELEGLDVKSGPFPVDRIVLYRSHLQRPAPRYEKVREFALGDVSGPVP